LSECGSDSRAENEGVAVLSGVGAACVPHGVGGTVLTDDGTAGGAFQSIASRGLPGTNFFHWSRLLSLGARRPRVSWPPAFAAPCATPATLPHSISALPWPQPALARPLACASQVCQVPPPDELFQVIDWLRFTLAVW
jgi:hypothetical protein